MLHLCQCKWTQKLPKIKQFKKEIDYMSSLKGMEDKRTDKTLNIMESFKFDHFLDASCTFVCMRMYVYM